MGVKDAGEGQRRQAGHPRLMGVAGYGSLGKSWVYLPGSASIVSVSLDYLRTTTVHFLKATVMFLKR